MLLSKITRYYSKTWVWVLTGYLLALLLSWSVMLFFETPVQLHKNQAIEEVETEMGERIISYYQRSPESSPYKEPLVLLHDNLYDAEALMPLAERLTKNGFDVIIPEYSGYGFTDYPGGFNLQDKKASVMKLLEHKGIDRFHLIGHGLGGAVAFSMVEEAGDRTRSVTMLSASGIQEFNLLGNRALNRALYFFQFPFYQFFNYLTPHFGWLYEAPFSYSTLKSNYEKDLRPVQEWMGQYDKPVLILHGADDRYVNVITAEEHNRLIPHSELVVLEGNQMLFQEKSAEIAFRVHSFIQDVENNIAVTRVDASRERIEKSKKPLEPGQISALTGLSLVLLLLLIVVSTFINEDLTCIGTGLLVAKGILTYIPAAAACFIGILLTDITVYWLGRSVGSPMLRWVPFRWLIDEEDVRNTESMFKESGLPIIFISRFIPGTRLPTYFSAGMVRARFSLIIFYFMMAILIWAPFLVGLSYLIGQQIIEYFYVYQDYAIWIFLALLLMIFTGLKVLIPMATKRGRRNMRVKVEKLKRRFWFSYQ